MSYDFMYQTDIGTVVNISILENDSGAAVVVTGATSITIEVQKPSGATASWTSTVGTDTTSIEHTIVAGDLTEQGYYKLRPKFTLGGWSGRGRPALVDVRGIDN